MCVNNFSDDAIRRSNNIIALELELVLGIELESFSCNVESEVLKYIVSVTVK